MPSYAAMASGGIYDDYLRAHKVKGFNNHSASAITKQGQIYCIWEVKEGISTEEFQKFIDGPTVQGFGIDTLMNTCKSNRYIFNEWIYTLSKIFS